MTMDRSLVETLRRTWDSLRGIRRDIATGGHIGAMSDIDALVGVALSETLNQLSTSETAARPEGETDHDTPA
ncbi:MAG: hypothetical protein ABIQ51_12405 [Mesorhizobium sp.]